MVDFGGVICFKNFGILFCILFVRCVFNIVIILRFDSVYFNNCWCYRWLVVYKCFICEYLLERFICYFVIRVVKIYI